MRLDIDFGAVMIGGYRNQKEYNEANPPDNAVVWFVFFAILTVVIFMVIL